MRAFTENGGRPADERGFVHKSKFGRFVTGKVGGVVKSALTATPVGRVAFEAGKFVKSRLTPPRTATARVTEFSAAEKELGKQLKFSDAPPSRGRGFRPRPLASGPCDVPMVLDSEGRCRMPTSGEFGVAQIGIANRR